jgi:ribonucleotide monophosphatase NagD (HAD superfamily)
MNIPFTRDPKDAAMFDIDDTLISSKTGKRIEDVYTIYKKIQKLGYKMIIVTARPGFYENVMFTRNQLAMHDIKYDQLVFTPAENKGKFKRESNYTYILSVGDMDTDLTDSKYSLKISI